jgi:hypothetical protein
MAPTRMLGWLTAALVALLPGTAAAQSTDGYHADLVLPVVVDTASYTTRITFSHQNGNPTAIRLTYLPAEGTTQASELECGSFSVGAIGSKSFASLRAACPGLPTGSQFGMLRARLADPAQAAADTSTFSFAAYARVDSAQGIGFAVEGFATHSLSAAGTRVLGLRRTAATALSPAFQSNCFVGRLDRLAGPPGFASPANVNYRLHDASGIEIGTGALQLQYGRLVRLLDVFAAAGVPAGDYDNVAIEFDATGGGGAGRPGIATFCTLQENTHFSADFRIGKVWRGLSLGSIVPGLYANDDHMQRISQVGRTATYSWNTGFVTESRRFTVPSGTEGNIHSIGLRHPDWVACELVPANNLSTTARAAGLEFRLVSPNGSTVLAGGNNATGFGPVFLGDKEDHSVGVNTRYTLDVERDGTITGEELEYDIRCRSGSGHTTPEWFGFDLPNRF